MRTHYCGKVSAAELGKTVILCGWAHRRRDHGGVIFIDLRDREGMVQIVSDPDRKETFAASESVRNEFVLKITGIVRRRPEGTVNDNTGWVLGTANPITLNTTSLSFSQFSAAGTIIAGDGLTQSGSTFNVTTASSGRIVVAADSIDLASGIVTASTYKSVTVDTYGRVTAGTNPTTLAGYGITDALSTSSTIDGGTY